ncbi:ABC transporter ATP-binding protein [Loktanella salsilacus]|uniref:ABC transporter ATP-binding protein n=1 Tax=Loktanella salsilacus TaxID=195913 RepID=UPI003735F6BD
MTLLTASDIAVGDGASTLLAPLSLYLDPGEALVILGETGSGKSLMAQALMGTLPPELTARGRVTIGAQTFDPASPERFRKLWGRQIGVLPQEPWLSLDPLMRAREQIAEAHALVRGLSRADARRRASADLAAMGLKGAEQAYPHELSGGMAQRVVIAAARAGGARIVIADEPTKGLDAARRDDVADLLLSEMGQDGGLLVITHDLTLARRMGGRMIVLRSGEVVESGATEEIFAVPQTAYTRDLFAADPERWKPRPRSIRSEPSVVQVRDLSVARGGRTLFSDISFDLTPGGIVGVTGPSGCGKSTLGDAVLGLIPLASGSVSRPAQQAPFAFQKLYQDPVAAFPRKQTLGRTITDTAALCGGRSDLIDGLLDRLGLNPVLLDRRPGAVSGGELQRLSLLRVLLRRPSLIFADEPTSRLDPITQAKVIGLLTDTARDDGVALMLVSHDPHLVRNTAQEVIALGAPATPGDSRAAAPGSCLAPTAS